ncbi:helix-turn-helix transcriptional regulator [Aromatoleum evansii]|uniref:helix-turn-helix transcriptional regulator n=1 Tax=Aromatoleum evansii TaxID=59406 RepID=UPI00145E9F2E|nr:WYL domain-containing protein [Aromatoleum evansii]NMG31761.1 WYL domain-containing protein [Aromatoleum evansii]
MAAYQDRIERQAKLLERVPMNGDDRLCPDASQLLEKLGVLYGEDAALSARRRAIQRDLVELVETGQIEPVNPGGKPLRYRRIKGAEVEGDNHRYVLELIRETVRNIVETEFPAGHLDAVWRRFLQADTDVGLGSDKMRVVTDTQRLCPADIRPKVLADVLEALALSRTLKATYRDRDDKTTNPTIHPQAFVQRGPRAYLYALKNDELGPVRMYALHRFVKTSVGDAPGRRAVGFSLEEKISTGQADFAEGETIDLELLARGYVGDLLRDCPLCATQRIEDEPEGSPFIVRVKATVPATGQLLRWLLGCGDNLQIVAPERLRGVVAAQVAKMAALYTSTTAAETA